jgi:Tfp pilus assembly protein PilF
VLANQGKLDEAIQHYERALQLRPDYADALNNLGAALAAQGK